MPQKDERRPSALTTSRKDGTQNYGSITKAIVQHELAVRNG